LRYDVFLVLRVLGDVIDGPSERRAQRLVHRTAAGLADGGYEAGRRRPAAAVPEPCGDPLLALSLLTLIGCRRG
jgi:hypothetical protein